MKVKFNVMDAVIVAVLLVVIVAGVLLLGGGSGGVLSGKQEDAKTIRLQVELKEQEEDYTKLLKVGDVVMIGVKEKMETTVTKVEVKPARMISYDQVGGRAYETELPDRYDVVVTLEGEGTESDSAIKLNGVDARVGAEAVVKSKNWAGVGNFLAVEPL